MNLGQFKQTLEPYKNIGPSIGWFCTYMPEEILHAAGFNTYGIRKSSGCEDDDVYLSRGLCSFVHSIFGGALEGKYDYMDGVIIPHCCECMRRLYDGWIEMNASVKPQFAYQFSVPTVNTNLSVEHFSKTLNQFKEDIEKQFNKHISDESLILSIKVYNKTRQLLNRLYELRKRENPSVSGFQVQEILDICMSTPKEKFNEYFEPYLQELEMRETGVFNDFRYRVLLYGGMYNPSIVKYIEGDGTGGIVVCEDACQGYRYFDTEINMEADTEPMTAISRRYLGKMPCARMAGSHGERTPDIVVKLVREFRADAVIYFATKRCDNLFWEYQFIKDALEKENIPIKKIEGDISGDIPQREIRSFIELLDFIEA